MFKTKKCKYFWREVRKIKGKVKNSRCIDETSNLKDVVEIFNKKCNKLLNDSECQSSSVANDPNSGLAPVMFSLNDLDIAINKLNQG